MICDSRQRIDACVHGGERQLWAPGTAGDKLLESKGEPPTMDGMSRLIRRCLLSGAALAALALPAATVLPQAASAASEANTALINAESVTTFDGITNGSGEPISLEQFAAENAGFHV